MECGADRKIERVDRTVDTVREAVVALVQRVNELTERVDTLEEKSNMGSRGLRAGAKYTGLQGENLPC